MRILNTITVLLAAVMLISASCVRSGAAESAGVTGSADIAETAPIAPSTETDSATGTPETPMTPEDSSVLISDIPSDQAHGTTTGSDNNTLFGIPLDSYNIITGKVKRNQFISSILSAHGVDWNDIEKLLTDNKKTFDPRRVRTGSSYSVLVTADTLSKADYFIYNHDPRVAYVFSLKDTLAIYRYDAEIIRTLRYSSGTISTSLWEAAQENNLNPNLSAELSEIYAWTIDFFGLQKGDRFKVIYEEEFIGEESVGIRRIHAAQFEHAGSTIFAIPYIQDSVMSFFDTTGASLRKAFLKAPLRYSRISSRFSGGRMHPILKIVRPHHGIDYAAPIGTPVLAIGDGRVTSTAYEGGAGRMVRITHNSVYSTAYLHLSRYGPGIAPGVYVKQGQVIGYVGSSGLSTGPHLDFRFYRNGSPIDPLRVEAPPVNPVAPDAMEEFSKVAEGYINLLATIRF
jgi:murein DD-endopeptidase MepM/ murein hydrolase activator NlpD